MSSSIASTTIAGDGGRYYESIDLHDAYHPQTIVAHSLNGAPIAGRQRRAAAHAHRTQARLQAAEIPAARSSWSTATRALSRRQGRLLGRQRLRLVRRYLITHGTAILQSWSLRRGRPWRELRYSASRPDAPTVTIIVARRNALRRPRTFPCRGQHRLELVVDALLQHRARQRRIDADAAARARRFRRDRRCGSATVAPLAMFSTFDRARRRTPPRGSAGAVSTTRNVSRRLRQVAHAAVDLAELLLAVVCIRRFPSDRLRPRRRRAPSPLPVAAPATDRPVRPSGARGPSRVIRAVLFSPGGRQRPTYLAG